MAQKNDLDSFETIVASKVLESLFGVKDRTIRDLADKGIVKRDSHGKYLLWNSAKGYITALKAINAGKNGINTEDDEQKLSYDEEHAIHERYKRQITEIQLQLIKGQVHKAEDVERVMTDMFEKFKSKINAIPSKMAKKLEGKTRTEIQTMLQEEMDAALTELSDYSPSDFYSDEHIDVPADVTSVLGGEADG